MLLCLLPPLKSELSVDKLRLNLASVLDLCVSSIPVSLFKRIFFNWRIITSHLLWWFLPYTNMNQPQVYMCPCYPEIPSHHPPHPISQLFPQALGALLHASNMHGSSFLLFLLTHSSHHHFLLIPIPKNLPVYS